MKNMNAASYKHIIDFYEIQKLVMLNENLLKIIAGLLYYLCNQFFRGNRDCDWTND